MGHFNLRAEEKTHTQILIKTLTSKHSKRRAIK